MTFCKSFPERLLLARAKAGMTQRALSVASKISIPQIVRYEAGRSCPRPSAILKLASALGISPNELTAVTETNGRKILVEFSNEEYAAILRHFQGSEEHAASYIRNTALSFIGS